MPQWSAGAMSDILEKNQASKTTAQGRARTMDEMKQPPALELRLLLACARAHPTPEHETAIRTLLHEDVDWTLFVRKAVTHGLAGLAGHTLGRVAPDLVPDEILGAFQAFIVQTRESNQVLLEELARLVERLAAAGVTTIPFKGPVLAQQAFGDLGLRGFRDLDFLIRDEDLEQAIRVLHAFGYQRKEGLTENQFALIHWLQGQEILFKKDAGAVEPHTRLISAKMALGVDYDGLWRRAQPNNIFGHEMLTFSPEDTLLVLAIHGGKELWWDIKWACDIADFIAAHPGLDWTAITARARAQGCYRMLLVATALSRKYLGANIPATLATAEATDPVIKDIIGRIMMRWEADDPGGPPSNKTLSLDRLHLHDGIVRQTSYILRTLLLPGPQHIGMVALPKFLGFAYIPIGLGHDLLALPLYRAYEGLLALTDGLRDSLAVSPVALALTPASRETKTRLRRFQQAYHKAARTSAANPKSTDSWAAMGDALFGLKRYGRAVDCYDKAITISPDHRSYWLKRIAAVSALPSAADRSDLTNAQAFDPENANDWAVRAGYLTIQKRFAEAAAASDCALRLDPAHVPAARLGIKARLNLCDWSQYEADQQRAAESAKADAMVVSPLSLKMLVDSEEASLSLARRWGHAKHTGKPLYRGEPYRHDKLRVAYLSTDFRSHPVGFAIVAPLEHHDRSRLEVTAISMGPDDGSQIRQRIEAAVDRFIDIRTMDDAHAAATLRDLEIDIAVDLNGYTGDRRPGILALKPAPVQVNYLGFPGTMAAPFIDYIIADPIVIPEENRSFYSEKVAYLPHSYLPYDRSRAIAEAPSSRREQGLPETGFVFASFNRLDKITPEIFAVWMRLLENVDGSVLWIPKGDPAAISNLRRQAAASGIAPQRVVFARYEKRPEDHLARQRLADIFLDTLPYNAHSTANDALWAGLPVLTCRGRAFPARVAASLLHTIGLPELVTSSLTEYEQRALELARNPSLLQAIRDKLARNRETAPLFNIAGFTRDLESVYAAMRERQRAGLAPESFSIAPRQ
jgi:predicted O-linked N-acetylglucosamine transferase (SPINDLY family)